MKISPHLITALTAAILFSPVGCKRPLADPTPQLINQLQIERQERQKAQSKADTEAQSKSRWQFVATLFAIASVIVLILGTALGSKARHDSEHLSS